MPVPGARAATRYHQGERSGIVERVLGVLCCSLLLLGLAACGNHARAPIEDRNRPAPPAGRIPVESSTASSVPGEYRVRQGDTLYAIAWRHGFDFRALAAANRIPPPYTIYPGQTLRLRSAPVPSASAVASRGGATAAAPASAAKASPARHAVPPAGKASPAGPVTPASSKPITTVATAPAVAMAPATANAPVSRWRWPAEGRVIRSFSSTVHKGIDISGERGDAVSSVADGVVVYAGTGIAGFGELLIVKHNDTYLSAYGHNARLLVAEGEAVRAGQRIAEKGSSGTDRVKLHFEIRRDGKPMDPLTILPGR